MDRVSHLVGADDLERALERLRATAAAPPGGLFGPRSTLWRIDRESALFLGAGRALLLQLAHPWVAAAVAQHSRSLTDPIGRFHRTFHVVYTMVFGTADQACAAARHLHRLHDTITGALPDAAGPFPAGSRYDANEADALQWVHATLIDTSILVHDLVLPPLDAGGLQAFWDDARRFAALFGIQAERVPADWAGFLAYNERMHASDTLSVSPAARTIAEALFAGAGTWLRMPRWYRTLTASMLPSRLREGFGLAYTDADLRAAHRAVGWLRRIYPGLPGLIRFVGPYHEARGRMAGRRRPGVITQVLNELWIGKAEMGG